jgi:hypothetical protein
MAKGDIAAELNTRTSAKTQLKIQEIQERKAAAKAQQQQAANSETSN